MDFGKDGFYFIPLGGSEQFGANLNVYVSGGKFLAVDCGIGFADERFPGIDLLLPDPALLEENKKDLTGLIITHAHEDHIGAAAYLYNRLRCPIYCTPFTEAVLRRKMEEEKRKDVEIITIHPGDDFKAGPFTIECLPVSHSVPDTVSLVIETGQGRVVHSGDWNLDPNPVAGYQTDPKTFKAVGEKGVLAYIGDSTNAEVPGRSGTESATEEGLANVFKDCRGKIAITTFSSNIGRVINIARAAQKVGRDVGVVGRSLHRMIGAAKSCGYMADLPDFVPEEDLSLLPDNKLVIIATGSQGEPRAALSKISRGEFPAVSLKNGDTVIFSARAIPGNEKSINEVKNNFSAAGVKIISPSDTDNIIHVSGHPCREEIGEMYQWLRPEVVIPVHGEHTQLQAQAEYARKSQIKHVIVPKNGSVVKLSPGKPELVDHIETDLLALDQKRIIPADHASILQRRKLQYTGAVHVTVVLNGRGELAAEPKLDMLGLIDEGEEQFEDNLLDEITELVEELTFEERLDDHFVTEELRIGVRRFVKHFLGVKPATNVHVVRV